MKYTADRTESTDVNIVSREGATILLTPEKAEHIAYNGAKGFNWGDGSSESAKLALAILFDVCHDAAFARRTYHFFKWDVIAQLPDAWELERTEIEKWIENTQAVLSEGEPF